MREVLPGLRHLKPGIEITEDGQVREVCVVRGYNYRDPKDKGDSVGEQGVYNLVQERFDETGQLVTKHILTQDTLGGHFAVSRGVILKDGKLYRFNGFSQEPSEEEIREFFKGFDSCGRFCYPQSRE